MQRIVGVLVVALGIYLIILGLRTTIDERKAILLLLGGAICGGLSIYLILKKAKGN